METSREKLAEMLLELSDDALEYVWRPINYAYYMTDDRGPDRLTAEDSLRFSLIGEAAHADEEMIVWLNRWERAMRNVSREDKMKKERAAI